jgi:hypothetical protein
LTGKIDNITFSINLFEIIVAVIVILAFIVVWIYNHFLSKGKSRIIVDWSIFAIFVTIIVAIVYFVYSGLIKFQWKGPNQIESIKTNVNIQNSSADRLEKFKSLINPNITFSSDKPNVAVVFESQNRLEGFFPGNELALLIKTSEKYHVITNLLDTNNIATKEFISEFFSGETDNLVRSGVMSHLHHIIFGKLQFKFHSNSGDIAEIISCDIHFEYQVIDSRGRVVRTASIDVIGPGFSNDDALKNGLEKISTDFSNQILNVQ